MMQSQLRNRQMNKQQTAATELSCEVASELGSELGDDTPSTEIWSKREKPKQESLVSFLANFTMPAVPLLQSLFEDFASELKKYREHWKKRREQCKVYWIKVQEECKRCLEFFECNLCKIDKQESQELKQKQQGIGRRSSPGAVRTETYSPETVTIPTDPADAGFTGQWQNTQ